MAEVEAEGKRDEESAAVEDDVDEAEAIAAASVLSDINFD